MVKFQIEGKEVLEKVVKPHGGGCYVYLPKAWNGEKVVVIRVGGLK